MVITRKVEFSASHVCRDPRLSDEENQRIYGMAANPHGHGHNYVVEVSLEGERDRVTGMVFDLKELKAILEREQVNFDQAEKSYMKAIELKPDYFDAYYLRFQRQLFDDMAKSFLGTEIPGGYCPGCDTNTHVFWRRNGLRACVS